MPGPVDLEICSDTRRRCAPQGLGPPGVGVGDSQARGGGRASRSEMPSSSWPDRATRAPRRPRASSGRREGSPRWVRSRPRRQIPRPPRPQAGSVALVLVSPRSRCRRVVRDPLLETVRAHRAGDVEALQRITAERRQLLHDGRGSTPSAMTDRLRLWARSTTEPTMAFAVSSVRSGSTKDLSILTAVTGRR